MDQRQDFVKIAYNFIQGCPGQPVANNRSMPSAVKPILWFFIMTSVQSAHTYRNVMDSLVAEEVERQVRQLPPKLMRYVNQAEVIAYALNRLPPLYATSEKGWQQQYVKAKREMHSQIVLAVRQALAAVQRDPLRSVAPLQLEGDRDAQSALEGLRELLGTPDLAWDSLVETIEQALIRTARGEITWRKRGSNLAESREWRDSRYML